ncbi:DNA-binding protein, partial [Yersinia pestis]
MIMAKARLHDDAMVQLLMEDPEFAQVYLHQALL